MKFYFSYGTSPTFPFKNGHSVVIADNRDEAIERFREIHPDKNGCVNCSFIYEESEWRRRIEGNFPMMNICNEIIGEEKEDE